MKTKIIYISGNEVFDMADIRAAFDEVRNTLGLGKDTVMFGVPVDQDDALNSTVSAQEHVSKVQENIAQPVEKNTEENNVITNAAEPDTTADIITETIEEEKIEEIPVTENIKKSNTRKPRNNSKAKKAEPVAENSEDSQPKNDEKIIPILSILAAKKEDAPADTVESTEEIDEVVTPDVVDDIPEHDSEESATDIEMPDIDINADFTAEDKSSEHSATIADMITDDAPEAPVEKTLEQLLESMTPLREDIVDETEDEIPADTEITTEEVDTMVAEDDTDATLEQLAAEFAENQDKIPTQPKSESHSKIGKLKNILPFKKAKRDDSGLMGDLFGWAGIAANDDDFAIPGFFTNAASKK